MKLAQSPNAKIDGSFLASRFGCYHDLACAIELQSAVVERGGRAYACRPDLERRRDSFTAVKQESVRVGANDAHCRAHVHAKCAKLLGGRRRDRVRECSQNARRAFEKRHPQPATDTDVGITRRKLDHPTQLSGQFDPCRATPDDGDVDSPILKYAAHYVCSQSRIECVSLVLAVDEVTMLGNPWRPEIVRAAAEREDEHVVFQVTRVRDRFAGTVHRRETHALGCPVDRRELAGNVVEAMVPRVQQILHLLLMDVRGARRKRMKDRLPHMRPAAVDQCDAASHARKPWSEARGQQQPGDAAADDDDARRGAGRQRRSSPAGAVTLNLRPLRGHFKASHSCAWASWHPLSQVTLP